MTKTESNKTEAKKHIIEIGTKVKTPENNYSKDVEVEIEYVYDNTKDKGLVETGELTKGKVETKVVDKYNPETGKIEQTSEEVVTKAKQKVIVGTKDFTGTYEYKKTCPIPFEVEIIEDDTLSKGEKVVKQQGQPGSKTTSYEQDIKNGQPEGEARKTSEETTEQPTKHIVRVGAKPLEGNRENVVDKAIPYETKVIYDENLEAGTRLVDNEGKDGKERVTTTITSKDGDIKVNSEGKVIEEKEDRVVRVGIKSVEKLIELPFETEYVEDENLGAGKTEISQQGTKGKAVIRTSFNKETGKLETKVERTEPTKRIIKIGKKPNKDMCPAPENSGKPDGSNPNYPNPVEPEGPGISDGENTQTPGGGESDNPGDKNPENPGKPVVENPSEPGGETPEEPGTPGEENPSQPGEDNPSETGNEEPGTPGSEEQGEVVENPETNSEIDDEDSTGKNTNPNEITEEVSSDAKTLPKTGGSLNASLYGYLMGVLGSGFLGLGALKKKKEDEEEEN